MAKRSPILGYNHNVRYRGLIFHVQTEDSGLMSPHLFTHMFHGGTIISTRKLVYDAGSAEESIKALMQAQHKAVLKDLRKGTFDDKIDQYLGATPGLLPRGANDPDADAGRDSEPVLPSEIKQRAETDVDLHRALEDDSQALVLPTPREEPVHAAPAISRAATPPPIPQRAMTPALPRTQTADRKSAPSAVRTSLGPPPPSDDLDPPTYSDNSARVAAMAASANTTKTPFTNIDSSPEIEIQLELDEPDDDLMSRTRSKHDTDVQSPGERALTQSDGIPGSVGGEPSAASLRPGESIPPLPPPPERRTGDRGSSAVGAATLPPARPITRPPSRPAMSPPTVVSRPLPQDDGRSRRESDAIEVYAPAPGGADPPPGAMPERPGQYAQHKRVSTKIPIDGIRNERERSGSVPIPSGLARPGRSTSAPISTNTPTAPIPREPPAPSTPPPRAAAPSAPPPRAAEPSRPPPDTAATRPGERARRPTPARISPQSTPATARTSTGSSQSGGVVMTRPAVIVGAPPKNAAAPRVRKAREEEGRGFGQGLISEKSLDEVILAYLSEDADEK